MRRTGVRRLTTTQYWPAVLNGQLSCKAREAGEADRPGGKSYFHTVYSSLTVRHLTLKLFKVFFKKLYLFDEVVYFYFIGKVLIGHRNGLIELIGKFDKVLSDQLYVLICLIFKMYLNACHFLFEYSDIGFEIVDIDFEYVDIGFEIVDIGFEYGDIGFEIVDIGFKTSDIGFEYGDIGFEIVDISFKTSDIGFEIVDISFEHGDIGFEIVDISFKTSNIGFEIVDIGFETSDIGFEIGEILFEACYFGKNKIKLLAVCHCVTSCSYTGNLPA